MATVSILHKTSYTDKDKKSPVVFVIRNKGTHAHINTGIKLEKKYWDEKKWVKKGAPDILNHLNVNTELRLKLGKIQEYLTTITNSGEVSDFTAAQIKTKFNEKQAKEKLNFNTYFKYVISIKSESTAKIYAHTLYLIEQFHPAPLSFSDINHKFLREFEDWRDDKTTNGTGIHLRNMRHVFNLAIDDDVIDLSLYPFRRFKIKKAETQKRNISAKKIRALRDVELSGIPGLARDVFMLQFYLIGINLKDISYMPKTALKNGRIKYVRKKTINSNKIEYNIKVEPEALALIKKLAGKTHLINIAERYQNYDSLKKEINKKLKVAATAAGLDEPVSTYYSRHSWATIAAKLNIPDEHIAASLGHKSAFKHKTTGIYIERDSEVVDKANRKVLDNLIKKKKNKTKNSNKL